MARIEGTGPRPPTTAQRVRRAIPKGPNPLLVVVVLTPVAVLAPTDWLRALAVVFAIGASYIVGYFEGRSSHARDDIRLFFSKERSDGVRRDNPGA